MLENVVGTETPDPLGEPALQMAQKCLGLIKTYHKGARTPLHKSAIIQDITTSLTSGTPQQFFESEVNDTLGSYLKIIDQHDRSIESASSRSEMINEPSVGSKWTGSPEPVAPIGK
jgi:hypothetical protein